MQLRRVVLLFAVGLLLAVLVSSSLQSRPPVPGEAARPPAPPAAGSGPEQIDIDVREPPKRDSSTRDAPSAESVEQGAHVIVTVSARAPGQIELEALGRTAPVDPGTPAVFDLLLDRPGTYPVTYAPVGDEARPVAELVVRPPSAEGAQR